MTESYQLRDDFRRRLFGILLGIPVLQDRDTRDLLLLDLPPEPVQTIRRHASLRVDLNNILEAAEGWRQLSSGEWSLVIIAQNAHALVEGTEPGRQLETLLAERGGTPLTTPSDHQAGFQTAKPMTGGQPISLPSSLREAWAQKRLLYLWGEIPFPLPADPPARRDLLLNRWLEAANELPPLSLALPQLPVAPLLSLDPTGRVETAFAQAGLRLPVLSGRRDVPVQTRHSLFKLGGDLKTRAGLILSRAEIKRLRSEPDKEYLLAEARRHLAGAGALLLLGCDPAHADFQAWWAFLAPVLAGAEVFTVGEPAAAWPAGVTCLGTDLIRLAATLRETPQVEAAAGPVISPAPPAHFDICLFCALAEEAKAVIDVVSHHCGVRFEPGRQSSTGRAYQYTLIENHRGEPLTVLLSWPPSYGPLEAALAIRPVLAEFRPHLAAMAGICAGDRRKTRLGDIIVAERAFTYDSGKVVRDDDGNPQRRHDANPFHPDLGLLQFARLFDDWQEAVAELPRPPSKRQQRDWLLARLLDPATPRIDDLLEADEAALSVNAPDWQEIMVDLQTGPQAYLTKARKLRNLEQVKALRFEPGGFPYRDPTTATCHIAPMASGSAVRSDDPFAEVQIPVRGTAAIEMEGAAFYRAVAEFSGISSLVVKGVCDYADPDKDDSYHHYAAQASAAYLLRLIQAYVTKDRFPLRAV